ncbi:MAG: hypothetical protein AAFQ74_04395 [Cyanobacteria bacterium J06623_4]
MLTLSRLIDDNKWAALPQRLPTPYPKHHRPTKHQRKSSHRFGIATSQLLESLLRKALLD